MVPPREAVKGGGTSPSSCPRSLCVRAPAAWVTAGDGDTVAFRGTHVWLSFRGCAEVAGALAGAGDSLQPRPPSISNGNRTRAVSIPVGVRLLGLGSEHISVSALGVSLGTFWVGTGRPASRLGLCLLQHPREAGQTCAKTLPVPSLSCVWTPSFLPLPEPAPLCSARGPLHCFPGR